MIYVVNLDTDRNIVSYSEVLDLSAYSNVCVRVLEEYGCSMVSQYSLIINTDEVYNKFLYRLSINERIDDGLIDRFMIMFNRDKKLDELI